MKWTNTIKEELGYAMAIMSLAFGFGLTTAGFAVNPVGEVHGSVLSVLGECFLFAAAVLGISLHIKSSLKSMSDQLNKKIDQKFTQFDESQETENK